MYTVGAQWSYMSPVVVLNHRNAFILLGTFNNIWGHVWLSHLGEWIHLVSRVKDASNPL